LYLKCDLLVFPNICFFQIELVPLQPGAGIALEGGEVKLWVSTFSVYQVAVELMAPPPPLPPPPPSPSPPPPPYEVVCEPKVGTAVQVKSRRSVTHSARKCRRFNPREPIK
jgi:hypothetical protein